MTEVEIRKLIKQMLYDSRNRARVSECRLCGQKTEGFCNSHTVPQFILKELAQNGKVLQASLFFGIEHVDIEKGISNSGTFHIICRNCDNSRFTAYENEQALLNKPSEKMLAQIELKNTLMQLSKRREEVELYKILYDRGLIEGKEVLDEMDYHYNVAYRVGDGYTHIHSENTTGNSILIIGDSYAGPVLPLLTSVFEDIWLIYPTNYKALTGSDFNYDEFLENHDVSHLLIMYTIENYYLSDEWGDRYKDFDVIRKERN